MYSLQPCLQLEYHELRHALVYVTDDARTFVNFIDNLLGCSSIEVVHNDVRAS